MHLFGLFDAFLTGLRVVASPVIRLMLMQILADAPYQFNHRTLPEPQYDFIVVGAGAAGSILAARLAETDARVLLLEAGGPAPPETSVPGLMPLTLGADVDYHIKLNTPPHLQQGFQDNSSFLNIGRTMGGGTTINAMIYCRCHKLDFDSWANQGNPGWDFESVLPYFKKSERYTGIVNPNTEKYHGRDGPISVGPVSFNSTATEAFLKAGRELGYDVVEEVAPTRSGFVLQLNTIGAGVRQSTAERFLRPNVRKSNLFVLTRAPVTKILFDKNKRAIGVEFFSNKKHRQVRARKEVILAAGAVFSPQILMLSGVGPARHLQEMGIKVLHKLEGVGRNYQDHAAIYNLPFAVTDGVTNSIFDFLSPKNLVDYIKQKSGPWARPFGVESPSYVKLGDGPLDWPDVSVPLMNTARSNLGLIVAVSDGDDLSLETFDRLLGPLKGRDTIAFVPMLLRPKSRGRVTLKSTSPFVQPNVDPGFLSHPDDEELLIRAIRFSFSIANTNAMKAIGAKWLSKPLRGCEQHPDTSKSYWRCFTRQLVSSFYHPSSTCKMAPSSDPMAVVSPELKVHGLKSLRVVDASIMPQIVSGNTAAPTFMIAEKAADLIKRDWGYPVYPPS
ncbi:glucose dehydrogenase [FAD, quinone] isoform X2 [Hyalella azteca]|uniref:Glucose dehydrogenase [FAD, quinone] isoform X2 n=1 Tax=Hyalella azteca TaxID=294128 RepID=A0A8B7NC24_HYAAZ|nr:glucose dehydrogenase [FAD, quinone] isoform X2 [Hyalella azteca]